MMANLNEDLWLKLHSSVNSVEPKKNDPVYDYNRKRIDVIDEIVIDLKRQIDRISARVNDIEESIEDLNINVGVLKTAITGIDSHAQSLERRLFESQFNFDDRSRRVTQSLGFDGTQSNAKEKPCR